MKQVRFTVGVGPADLAWSPQLGGCVPWHGVELALSDNCPRILGDLLQQAHTQSMFQRRGPGASPILKWKFACLMAHTVLTC